MTPSHFNLSFTWWRTKKYSWIQLKSRFILRMFCRVMGERKIVFFILVQGIMFTKHASCTNSALFKTRENTRLNGHVVKQFLSPSLMSCNHWCLRNSWSPQSLWWLLVFQASIRSINTRWCNRSTMAKMDQAARKSVSCCWYRGQNEAKSFFTLLCWRRGVWHLRNFAAERRWFWNGERETHRVLRPQKECRVWNLQLSASETES